MTATNRAYKSARRLRKQMSLPEVLLWRLLRKAQPPIRRQHPLGEYILDFYCPAARLIVEVDGYAHQVGNRPRHDEQRHEWIETQRLKIVRIDAREVLRDPEAVADSILRLCQDMTPPPQR